MKKDHDNHKEIHKQICDFMGENLDAPVCKEVAEHLKSCPNCKVHLDTVKKTITLCQEADKDKNMPAEVKDRLFKVLDLDQWSARK